MHPTVIRAGKANMFLSEVFTEAFVNVTGVPVELYDMDGSAGAAKGAGIGIHYYVSPEEACGRQQCLSLIEPTKNEVYQHYYKEWKTSLNSFIV